jgi:exopolyphosphatase/guanosine-5'-triphosphate,3'-diphosphate pyrophosphatase
VSKLIGSSGAFDTYAEILHFENHKSPLDKTNISNSISVTDFNRLYQKLMNSNREQRLLIPGMEAIRVDTIVMSAIFTKFVSDKINVTEIIQSAYSLKEGVASHIK